MYLLRLLGGTSLEGDSGPTSGHVSQQRPLAVLAILAVARDKGCSRDKVIGYLWSETDQERGRHGLADAVYKLRKSLGESAVLASGDVLRLNPAVIKSDVWAFDDALDANEFESAARLYEGPLLDGFFLSGSPEFERWLDSERQRLAERCAKALEALAERAEATSSLPGAVEWWRRLVAYDPYNTRVALRLMQAMADSGDRANALQYAKEHERLLRDELGLEPDPQLTALVERLKREPAPVTEGVRAPKAYPTPSLPDEARTEAVRRRRFLTLRNAGLSVVAALAVWGIVAAGRMLFGDGVPEVVDARQSIAGAESFADAGPGIAVLPFSVHGEGLEAWREGMVDLLSTGMNSVGGLRAIDSRTVMARWRERVPEAREVDRAMALEVAQATGARYALIGSAVAIGRAARLSADIYDVEDGAQLASVQVEGSPDSVLALVDRLAVQSLVVVLQQEAGELPPVDLASVTTASLPALTAWLEAEALHRRGEIVEAVAAYERAVAADSTFALALYGLSQASAWYEGGTAGRRGLEQAMRWIDRLPVREAALVRATDAWYQDSLREADEILQRLVRTYPTYAMAWYGLGELYYHSGTAIPVSLEDAHRCFTRAVELDPQFAPYRIHLVDLAFQIDPDSAQTARLIADYKRLASPDVLRARLLEFAFVLAFGDEEHNERAVASLDTLDLEILRGMPFSPPLVHPRFWRQFEAVLLASERRGVWARNPTRDLFRGAALGRGYLSKALEYLDRPQATSYDRGCLAVDAYMHGLPVPPARLEEAAAVLSQIDSASEPALVYCAAFIAADQGRWADQAEAVELSWDLWRREVDAGRSGRAAKADALAAEAYGLWRQGKPEAAVEKLEEVGHYAATDNVRTVLGYVLVDLERWDEAVPYLRAWWRYASYSTMHFHIARAYERMGEYGKAAKEYVSFVEAWEDADPELQPWIEDARQALVRLSPDR